MKGRLLFGHLLTAAFPGRPRHATARVVLWEHGGRNSRLKVQGKREGGKLQTGRRQKVKQFIRRLLRLQHVMSRPLHSGAPAVQRLLQLTFKRTSSKTTNCRRVSHALLLPGRPSPQRVALLQLLLRGPLQRSVGRQRRLVACCALVGRERAAPAHQRRQRRAPAGACGWCAPPPMCAGG